MKEVYRKCRLVSIQFGSLGNRVQSKQTSFIQLGDQIQGNIVLKIRKGIEYETKCIRPIFSARIIEFLTKFSISL